MQKRLPASHLIVRIPQITLKLPLAYNFKAIFERGSVKVNANAGFLQKEATLKFKNRFLFEPQSGILNLHAFIVSME